MDKLVFGDEDEKMNAIIRLGARIQRKRDGVISANRALDGARDREAVAKRFIIAKAQQDGTLDEDFINTLINARKRIQANTDNASQRKADVRGALDKMRELLGVSH